MTWKQFFTDWRIGLTVGLIATLICYFVAGPKGATGMALGIFGTSFSMLALLGIIRLAEKVAAHPGADVQPSFGSSLAVLAFLVKLPVVVGLGMYAQSLGTVPMNCFLWGLGLVYFAMVGWAQATV